MDEAAGALILLAGTTEPPVSPEWAHVMVAGVRRVTNRDLEETAAHMMSCWGGSLALDGVTGVKRDAKKKITLLEWAFTLLSTVKCRDSRMQPPESDRMIVHAERLPDEAEGVERILRPERTIHVRDPLAFNMVLRRLQSTHPDWPRSNNVPLGAITKTTKGITQPLQAIGFGPIKMSKHGYGAVGARGPPDTDPDKALVDGVWRTTGTARDGLYFTQYVYAAERVKAPTNMRYVWTMP